MAQDIIPKPKFDIGDIVYLRNGSKPLKVLRRCYDEHWRYEVDGIEYIETYWFYEKYLKRMEE